MTRIPVRIASVLLAAGVAAAAPSVAHATPQAPATKPSTYKLLATPSAAAVHYWKTMYIKGQKQKKGNWCGP
ncbi:MAG: hypothetical protein JWO75_2431, partial [Actinomycetia bacterium]|nr:hypothetical protein [Actinomycetes bacterium]